MLSFKDVPQFREDFKPSLTPYQMEYLGVFNGTYFKDDFSDFEYTVKTTKQNYFGVQASQPMEVWMEKGWITPEDPIGWYQWYTRYFHGRRLPEVDDFQIKRWKSFVARHSAQVKKNGNGDLTKRLKQRQSLLHWAANPIPDVDLGSHYKLSLFSFLLMNKNGSLKAR